MQANVVYLMIQQQMYACNVTNEQSCAPLQNGAPKLAMTLGDGNLFFIQDGLVKQLIRCAVNPDSDGTSLQCDSVIQLMMNPNTIKNLIYYKNAVYVVYLKDNLGFIDRCDFVTKSCTSAYADSSFLPNAMTIFPQ